MPLLPSVIRNLASSRSSPATRNLSKCMLERISPKKCTYIMSHSGSNTNPFPYHYAQRFAFSTDATNHKPASPTTTTTTKRRRRKRNSGRNDETSGIIAEGQMNQAYFRPKQADGKTEVESFDEYLATASLSPWVPTPDPVARRMLEIAKAGKDDIHFDLGSGDGRLNFMAIDSPFEVKQSIGIDVDKELLSMSDERLSKIHPRPTNIEFVYHDLLPPTTSNNNEVDNDNKVTMDDANEIQSAVMKNLLSDCTVLTMYFVEDALQKIKPMLNDVLGGSNCRVVTCGYAMDGWEPDWAEVVLGLPVYLYVMRKSIGGEVFEEPLFKEREGIEADGDGDEVVEKNQQSSPLEEQESTHSDHDKDEDGKGGGWKFSK